MKKMFVVHDVLDSWELSPFFYDSPEKAVMFFEDIHRAYYRNYRVAEVSDNVLINEYEYEDFLHLLH